MSYDQVSHAEPAGANSAVHSSITRESFSRWKPWLTTEIAILRRVYPSGGVAAVRELLPIRTVGAIHGKAGALGIKCWRPSTIGKRFARLYPLRDDIDTMIREGYTHAKRKGDIARVAERIGRPAWWVQKRAAQLGVTRTNRTRLDGWTQAELEILETWASATHAVIAKKLKAAGYTRTPTAVCVKLKRMQLDRTDPDRWSATQLGPLLGVNPATVADWIERRGLPATRAGGGKGTLIVSRERLRGWVARNAQWIDLRRVDQPWFRDLMWGAL